LKSIPHPRFLFFLRSRAVVPPCPRFWLPSATKGCPYSPGVFYGTHTPFRCSRRLPDFSPPADSSWPNGDLFFVCRFWSPLSPLRVCPTGQVDCFVFFSPKLFFFGFIRGGSPYRIGVTTGLPFFFAFTVLCLGLDPVPLFFPFWTVYNMHFLKKKTPPQCDLRRECCFSDSLPPPFSSPYGELAPARGPAFTGSPVVVAVSWFFLSPNPPQSLVAHPFLTHPTENLRPSLPHRFFVGPGFFSWSSFFFPLGPSRICHLPHFFFR